jgi:molybdate transport system ATP-binding protein
MARDHGLSVRLAQDRPIPLDVAFDCPPGQMLALLGPSGSGKSTVLRCIAGLHRPRSGSVQCAGETWLDTATGEQRPAHRRRIGFVFQSYALFPHMTAEGNVAAALGHLPAGERRGRARALLDRVHLSGLHDRRPAELSGGQQQRVAVARALARDPQALLLDEPFSAVDRATRERLYGELAELKMELRMPIVLVTHDLEEAAMLADRMAVLHRGRTLQIDPPDALIARPASLTIARLVGHRNLFDGVIAAQHPDEGRTLLSAFGAVIEARHDGRFAPGERVAWTIPEGGVLLHRRDRPSRGERENPIAGTVTEALRLGDTTHVRLAIAEQSARPLRLRVPHHVAQRNGIATGVAATVSLLADSIHLMPAEAEP